jgi:hypothetical protein
MGRDFKGCYDLLKDELFLFDRTKGEALTNALTCSGFDDKLIDQFLSFFFCDHSIFKISFNINIKECRSTSKGSCSSIIFFCSRKISHINRLNSFFRIFCRF